MTNWKAFFMTASLATGIATAQSMTQEQLLKPLGDDWPTYNGDYSGQRYSHLKQINQSNVRNLTLAWSTRFAAGAGSAAGGGRGGRFGGGGAPTIIGGEGTGDTGGGAGFGGGTNIRASVLKVEGTLY